MCVHSVESRFKGIYYIAKGYSCSRKSPAACTPDTYSRSPVLLTCNKRIESPSARQQFVYHPLDNHKTPMKPYPHKISSHGRPIPSTAPTSRGHTNSPSRLPLRAPHAHNIPTTGHCNCMPPPSPSIPHSHSLSTRSGNHCTKCRPRSGT